MDKGDSRKGRGGVFPLPSPAAAVIDNIEEKGFTMHLFETEKGDRWVCIVCGEEQQEMIREKKWEHIFDRDDQTLRCSLCGKGDFDIED